MNGMLPGFGTFDGYTFWIGGNNMAEISVSLYKPRSLVGKEMYHRLLDDYPERFINLAVDLWLESVGLTNSPGLRYSVRAKLIRHFTKNEPYWFKSGDLNGNLVVLRLRP